MYDLLVRNGRIISGTGNPRYHGDLAIVKGKIDTIGRLVEVLCENPAKIFGMYPCKGALIPGAHADLIIFDPEKHQVCSAETQHGRSDYCLYEGIETVGAPVVAMQRGKVLVENGNLLARAGDGRYLPASNPIWY